MKTGAALAAYHVEEGLQRTLVNPGLQVSRLLLVFRTIRLHAASQRLVVRRALRVQGIQSFVQDTDELGLFSSAQETIRRRRHAVGRKLGSRRTRCCTFT